MDPQRINKKMIQLQPKETYENLMKYMDTQHYMDSIVLPYHYGWVHIFISLIISSYNFKSTYETNVHVFDYF